MKRLFKSHINFFSMAKRFDDEFFSQADLTVSVPQEKLRWFCGTHDLQATFICQAL